VDLMHVIHRPRLPRLVSVSLAAATLAIAISLALASSLSNIGRPGDNTTNPFASLLSRPLPPSWLSVP
jgi:hypothetical protein